MVLRGTTRCYKVLYVILRELEGITRQFEILKVVLRDTTRYYESLWGTRSGTRRYYVLYCKSLCGIRRCLRYNVCLFRGVLPKITFQKNRYEKFYKIHGKATVVESLHYSYFVVSRSTTHSTRSVNCMSSYNWSTQTWKITKESFSFIKSYYQNFFCYFKRCS